jgi:uncharacterized protein YfaQ (DUF2300 family)
MKQFYWDAKVRCYDCRFGRQRSFWSWTDDPAWLKHAVSSGYMLGDVRVPDTCLILNQIPVDDENFL